MKKFITYGTFDLFHIGHLKLLRRMKEMGGEITVAVSTDEFNLKEKNKKTIIPFEQRVEIIQAIKYVDNVIPENSWEQKVEDIKKLKIDTFVMGDDWLGKFDFLKEYCEVIYLKRTTGISTTILKESLNSIKDISKDDIVNALEILDQLRNGFR